MVQAALALEAVTALVTETEVLRHASSSLSGLLLEVRGDKEDVGHARRARRIGSDVARWLRRRERSASRHDDSFRWGWRQWSSARDRSVRLQVTGTPADATVQETDSLKFMPSAVTVKTWTGGRVAGHGDHDHSIMFDNGPQSDTMNKGDTYELRSARGTLRNRRMAEGSVSGAEGSRPHLRPPIEAAGIAGSHCPSYATRAPQRYSRPSRASASSKGLCSCRLPGPRRCRICSPRAWRSSAIRRRWQRHQRVSEHMKQGAKEKGFNFTYVRDDTQEIARAYGALRTPHFYVFDQDRKLRYVGRIDDSDVKTVTSHDARNAIDALLAGKPVPVEKTRTFGCSTKWMSKRRKWR